MSLTNLTAVIFKESILQDKRTEDEHDLILEELGRAFQGTPTGELQQLRFFKHVCTIQQSGKWFIKATDCHRLGSGARQEAVNARNLLTSIKVALVS
jgi:hypothetical protein